MEIIMKKILALVLALITVLGCAAALTACKSKAPALNYDDAKEALEDADYSFLADDEDVEDDPVYEARLSAINEDGEYLEIYWFESEAVAKLFYTGLKMEKEQKVEDLEFEIKFLKKCKKEHKNDYRSSEIDDIDEAIAELKDELKRVKNNKDESFGRDGSIVWIGTLEAIEATRG